jgi:GTP1/Obg family GTP-binding protein
MKTTSLWRIDDAARQTPTVDMDKVKILVVGEPATGKSAFVQVCYFVV